MENAPMHRPMRQASRQVRNIDQLHAIVEACHTVRIGALDEEGMFIVPMSFGYDWADPESPGNNAPTPRLALWVHSASEGRKAELFNREPRVAIEMDIEDGVIEGPYACAYSYAYRSIMGTGTVHRIQGAPKQNVTGSPESCIIWPPELAPVLPTKRWPAQTSTAST